MSIFNALKNHLVTNIFAYQSGVRLAIATFIAYVFYLSFDLQFGYWAVVTVAAVMQPNLKMTNLKGWLRLLGTLIGVIIGLLAIFAIKYIPHSFLIWFFLALFLSALIAFYSNKYSYIGLIGGITTVIILTTYNQEPQWLHNVIVNRTIDVATGIIIAWICAKLIFPKVTESVHKGNKNISSGNPIKYALSVAISATISLVPWVFLPYSGGYWAPISCLFVVEESFEKTQQKSLARFFAHLVVMIIAAILSFSLNSFLGISVALVIGMFIFGYAMEKPIWRFEASIANTMAIAYAIVLLTAPGEINTLHTVLARFLNTTFGIAVGIFVVNFSRGRRS